MEFRQRALSKLQSPEELDLPVKLARPQSWLVLTVTVAVVAAAAVWAVTGSVSSTLSAPGILTHAEGAYVLQSPLTGQVTDVLVQEGDTLPANAPLLDIRTTHGVQPVRAVAAGRVLSLPVKIGAVLSTGADVATLERVSGSDDPLVAVVYVSGGSGPTLPVGAAVDLTVQSVPAGRYGVLRGRIEAVGRAAQTRQQITGFLGDSQLGEEFSAHGAPVAVVVRLNRSAGTKSGYGWSKASGPPYAVDSMTPVSAAVHLPEQRPLDWLLP